MIVLKTDGEIDAIRAAGKISAEILDLMNEYVRPGVSTQELNDIAHAATLERGGIPAPLNYRGFPKSICTSVNEVVCHGIPNPKHILREGDIVNIDVTTILDGFHGDTSRMYMVGQVAPKSKKLAEVALEAMQRGIAAVKVGSRVGDVGAAIQEYAEGFGYGVVREFVGHGIGRTFHEDPQIPHYGRRDQGMRFQPGMAFTIEPMINEGHWKTKVLKDGWTAITIDGKLSAQWEHTLAIKSDGSIVICTEA